MKKKELKEFMAKSIKEINQKVVQLEKEKVEMLMMIKMGKVKNVHLAKKIRKDIAQLKTIVKIKSRVDNMKTQKEKKTNGTS